MSDKRFKVVQDPRVQTEYFIYDNENKISRNITDYPFINEDVCSKIVMLLNEQQDIIITLKRRLEKINGGYGHLTHYKGLTANEWLIDGQEKEIKRKDEQISKWIEQHSKDVVKIGEQNKLIQNLTEENEKLKNFIELIDVRQNVEKPQKNKKSGWDSEPNTDYVTRVKEGLK